MDLSDFYQGLSEFRKFFTVKHMVVLLIVGLSLVAICGPRDVMEGDMANACDTACPLPKVINMPEIRIEEVSQENWSYDLLGQGWLRKDSSIPSVKSKMVNRDKECMLLFSKEEDNASYGNYVLEVIKAFTSNDYRINSVSQVIVNGDRFVLAEFRWYSEIVWSWITVKNGIGYNLSCGCDINVDAGNEQSDMCQFSGDSIRIK